MSLHITARRGGLHKVLKGRTYNNTGCKPYEKQQET
jgi:hypothetical protein